MEFRIESIPEGSVTCPRGFSAGATYAGIKKKAKGSLDLAILFSETPCTAAAVFTTNKVQAAPVALSRRRLQVGRAVALVVNSGCANACTGELGMVDTIEMARLAANHIGASPEEVLVASTGVIGQRLPMDRIRAGLKKVVLSNDGGHRLARAIMTTDTVPKEVAISTGGFTIGGVAKGAGMIHPDLATLLCFLTTDANVELECLRRALREAVNVSFNMISIDGDTSTNDTVLIMANGLSNTEIIKAGSSRHKIFQQAINQVCIYLAKAIARDGEGATKLIEVTISGAANMADARLAARTIVSSPLVKSAVHGSDPNWGRVLAAAGRSGVEIVPERVGLSFGDICLVESGLPQAFDKNEVIKLLNNHEIIMTLNLNLGKYRATAWGCDLSEEYVAINSQYTT